MTIQGRQSAIVVLVLALSSIAAAQSSSTAADVDDRLFQADLVAAAKAFLEEEGPEVPKVLDAQGNPLPISAQMIPKLNSVEELFQATIDVTGAPSMVARTHLFRDPIRIIPYADVDDIFDAAGNAVPRGDAAIAAYFPSGEVGFTIKHHRSSHRTLKLANDVDELKEDVKLRDSHIGVVIGVMRGGRPGAITCNSPQDYMKGRFGAVDYPMIFVRPRFPSFIDPPTRKLFIDNLRTMVVAFNAISVFPSEYNGGDPLGARDQKRIREHVAMMLRAVGGDPNAQAYFASDEHKLYCAEMAFVAITAALLVPLNEQSVTSLLQEFGDSPTRALQVWVKFQQEIALHNRGQQSAFVAMNDNKLVRLVQLADGRTLEKLKPLPEYGDEKARAAMSEQLAFPPMTISDIIESFLRIYVPRQQLGERVAPAQGAILRAMKPGLYEAAAMTANSEAAQKLGELLDRIIAVVEKSHANYDEFRRALEPYLAMGRGLGGSRPGDDAGGLFVPPMLFHLVARGDRQGGLISLDYVGHGLHYSLVRPVTAP